MSSISAFINKRIRDGVTEKKPKRDRNLQQESSVHQRLRSVGVN